jgi:uncharacterized membrane-anchored protein YjiN (DUF445 family)
MQAELARLQAAKTKAPNVSGLRKLGMRTAKEIEKTARDRAKQRLELVQQGTNIPFSAQMASDLLAAIGTAAVREEGNVGAAFAEKVDKRKAKQKEIDKLTTQQKIANLEAQFKAEDQIVGLPSKVKEKLAELQSRKLKQRTMLAKLKKLEREAMGGTPRKSVFNFLGEDAVEQSRDTLDKTLPSMKFSNNEAVDNAVKEDISNLSNDAKEALIQAARQEIYLDDQLNDFTVALARAYKKLGKGFFTKGDNLSNKPGTIFSRTLGID